MFLSIPSASYANSTQRNGVESAAYKLWTLDHVARLGFVVSCNFCCTLVDAEFIQLFDWLLLSWPFLLLRRITSSCDLRPICYVSCSKICTFGKIKREVLSCIWHLVTGCHCSVPLMFRLRRETENELQFWTCVTNNGKGLELSVDVVLRWYMLHAELLKAMIHPDLYHSSCFYCICLCCHQKVSSLKWVVYPFIIWRLSQIHSLRLDIFFSTEMFRLRIENL